MNACFIMSAKHGAGRHRADILPAEFAIGLHYNFMTQCLTPPCIAFVKISIGLFLIRLSATALYRRICIGFIVIMGIYSFASMFTIIFQCMPISFSWDPSGDGKCMPSTVLLGLAYSFSIVTVISDFFLVLLPVAMLWDVKIPRRQRWAVCGILGVGALYVFFPASWRSSSLHLPVPVRLRLSKRSS